MQTLRKINEEHGRLGGASDTDETLTAKLRQEEEAAARVVVETQKARTMRPTEATASAAHPSLVDHHQSVESAHHHFFNSSQLQPNPDRIIPQNGIATAPRRDNYPRAHQQTPGMDSFSSLGRVPHGSLPVMGHNPVHPPPGHRQVPLVNSQMGGFRDSQLNSLVALSAQQRLLDNINAQQSLHGSSIPNGLHSQRMPPYPFQHGHEHLVTAGLANGGRNNFIGNPNMQVPRYNAPHAMVADSIHGVDMRRSQFNQHPLSRFQHPQQTNTDGQNFQSNAFEPRSLEEMREGFHR